jgi:hypothetical protein
MAGTLEMVCISSPNDNQQSVVIAFNNSLDLSSTIKYSLSSSQRKRQSRDELVTDVSVLASSLFMQDLRAISSVPLSSGVEVVSETYGMSGRTDLTRRSSRRSIASLIV